MIQVFLASIALLGSQERPASAPALQGPAVVERAPAPADVRNAIAKGADFLVKSQNADGSWGGVRNKTFTDSFANVETHHAWTVATTGLCCVALMELSQTPEANAACDKGLDYICANADLKRPDQWDTDNTWGYIYGLQGVAKALANPRYKGSSRDGALRKAADTFLGLMKKYQSDKGGWAYYADPEGAYVTGLETSFGTAAGVIALCDARDAGLTVDEKMLLKARAAVERCRLPNGAFTYSNDVINQPGNSEFINNVKGSLGRIQVCHLAMLRAGSKISKEQIRWGLDQFFEHHKFLDVGRMKPIPHEAYYAVAGYFYFFGHYYAGRLLETLPPNERAEYAPRLQKEILKTIESDGAMWDFYISSNTRPYGTSFGIMTLGSTLIGG